MDLSVGLCELGEGMTYEEFKAAFLEALRESRLPVIGFARETLDLGALSRTFWVGVEPIGRLDAPPFHTSASIEWRWDALDTARTATTEEDMLTELLGREDAHDVETERPWLRVDIALRASLPFGQPAPMPKAVVWAKWAHETVERLEDVERIVPEEMVRAAAHEPGLPEILAWQGEPAIKTTCGADGELKVTGIELAAWQAIELPRVWDDPDREPDDDPADQLAGMFERVRAALHSWTEVLDHLR